jgi:hypothetical protein
MLLLVLSPCKPLKFHHISSILESLHWLKINDRIQYKVLSVIYETLHSGHHIFILFLVLNERYYKLVRWVVLGKAGRGQESRTPWPALRLHVFIFTSFHTIPYFSFFIIVFLWSLLACLHTTQTIIANNIVWNKLISYDV